LIAGKCKRPSLAIWYRRCTPVVVSSDTPLMLASTFAYQPGCALFALGDRGEQDGFLFVGGLCTSAGFFSASVPARSKGWRRRRRPESCSARRHRPIRKSCGCNPNTLRGSHPHGEYRRATAAIAAGRLILGREDIAGGPADIRAQMLQGFDQHPVWMVMWSEPAIRAPLRGCFLPNSARSAMRPASRSRQWRFPCGPVGEADVFDCVVGHVVVSEN